MASGIKWYLPRPQDCKLSGDVEHIDYVGCIHQMTPEFEESLRALVADPPDYLFFGGDFTGSRDFDTLKYHFYEVVKIGRDRLKLHESPGMLVPVVVPPDVILSASRGVVVNGQVRTLRQEYLDFLAYVRGLQNLEAVALSDDEIISGITGICQFKDYGTYFRTLPDAVRQRIINSFADTSKTILPYVRELQDRGVHVHMIAGNWDNQANTAKSVGMETAPEQVFDAATFFRQHDVALFQEHITTVITRTTVQVLVPYWEIYQAQEPTFPPEARHRLAQALLRVDAGRRQGKTIIVLAHGQPLWGPHRPGATCQDYNVKVMENLAFVIDYLRPDELIYPHQHDPMKNLKGEDLPVNTHYFITSLGNGAIRAVRDEEDMMWQLAPASLTVATYIPLRHIAHLQVPILGNRRTSAFGGTRLPAMVQ